MFCESSIEGGFELVLFCTLVKNRQTVDSGHNWGMERIVKVKICGITNLEDALVAADAAADYLGFIFYPPSKRAANPADVEGIVNVLRQRPRCPILVGVFVDESAEHVDQVLRQCDLNLAQLHGNETPYMVNDPRSILYGRAYKALRPQSVGEAEAEAEWFIAEAPTVRPTLMMDSYHPILVGGTGEISNWEIGKQMVSMTDGFMLAGGLTAANVAQAVREVRPYAVDVASGVEASPGNKNPEAVWQFIKEAQRVIL